MTTSSTQLVEDAMALIAVLSKGESPDENAADTIKSLIARFVRQSEKLKFHQEFIKAELGNEKLQECLNRMEENESVQCDIRPASVNSVEEGIDTSENAQQIALPNFNARYQSAFTSSTKSQSQSRQPFTYHNPAFFQGFIPHIAPSPIPALMPYNNNGMYHGTIKRIGDKYGWIEVVGLNDDLFVHVSDVLDNPRNLKTGQSVAFQITNSKDGRIKATHVRIK